MKLILHRTLLLIVIATFGFSAPAAELERAVYSIVFREGVRTPEGNPFAFDNRYLAEVSVNVITNFGTGPVLTNLATVRGSTIPDQFWNPSALTMTRLDSIGGFNNALRSLQMGAVTNLSGVPNLSNLVSVVNNAYEGQWPIIEDGMYNFVPAIPDVPQSTTPPYLRLAGDNWVPTMNKVARQINGPFTEIVRVYAGAREGEAITFMWGPTIHPNDWGKFVSVLPKTSAWSQNYYHGWVIIYRRDNPRKPGVPTNFHIVQ
jgi:hypothetical protein